jgi:hypothetical protein
MAGCAGWKYGASQAAGICASFSQRFCASAFHFVLTMFWLPTVAAFLYILAIATPLDFIALLANYLPCR